MLSALFYTCVLVIISLLVFLGIKARQGMTIRLKLLMLCLCCCITAVTVTSYLSYSSSSDALVEQKKDTLLALAYDRKLVIYEYFNTVDKQIQNFAANRMIGEAVVNFTDSFHRLDEQIDPNELSDAKATASIQSYLTREFRPRIEQNGLTWRGESAYMPKMVEARLAQAMYIALNPEDVGSKHQLDRSKLECDYNQYHATYHPVIRQYLESFEYYDIFLFDLEGNLIYSVYKEADFATNLLNGPYKDSNFADALRKAINSNTPGATFLEDFKPYEPSYGAAACFISSPVFFDGQKVGAAVFQKPVAMINAYMQKTEGLGDTGETYLVGDDGFMRSNSRFSDEPTLLTQKVEHEGIQSALAGEQGVILNTDETTGERSYSAYVPFQFKDLNWAIVADIQKTEVLRPAHALAQTIMISSLIITIIIAGVALLVAYTIIKPIQDMIVRFREIAQGDGDLRTTLDESRSDELGELAHWFNLFVHDLGRTIAGVKGASLQVVDASNLIADGSLKVSNNLEEQMNQVRQISAASEELTHSAIEVANRANQTLSAAGEAGNHANSGGTAVKSTITEMKQIAEAVRTTAEHVESLGKRSEAIGEVIQVINDIADQTNLLALNAAIEAARAGEHGQGFAVVADEVRKLADRTTQATQEIADSIRSIQSETHEAVERMNVGSELVESGVRRAEEAGHTLASIESSTEEVQKMIESITESSNQQSDASNDVSKSILEISEVIQQSSRSTVKTADAVKELSTKSSQLNSLVDRLHVDDPRANETYPLPQGIAERRIDPRKSAQELLDEVG